MAAFAVLTTSCAGSTTPVQPTSSLSVSSVFPSSGPTIGGTVITITGSDFAPGAAVTIRGTPATTVTVINATILVATTAPAVPGLADVTVSSGGRVATLPGGYTYALVNNTLPVISSISAQGTRSNEPSNFADLDEEINVAASVTDAETPPDKLTYEWSLEVGTMTGTGAAVRWKAPHDLPKTPASYSLNLTVTEQYQTTDDNGAVITKENKVTGKVTVHVHNSRKEVSDLAFEFLTDFSNSAVSADAVVSNFSNNSVCGKQQEHDDIADNRATRLIKSHDPLIVSSVTFNFGGFCPLPQKRPAEPGDACVVMSCGWNSTVKATGAPESVHGTCYVTEVYEDPDRWRLCWSEFGGVDTLTGKAVTGLRFSREP